jgi:hypothetical protein
LIIVGWSRGLTLPKWKDGFSLDRGALFAFVVIMVVVVVVVVVIEGEIGSRVWFGVVRVGLVSEEGTRRCSESREN